MRQIVEQVIDPALCRRTIAALDRLRRALPEEEHRYVELGVDSDAPPQSLADAIVLAEAQERVLSSFMRSWVARDRNLELDGTFYVFSGPGHERGPHLDTAGYPHRVASTVAYLSDCEGGELVFPKAAEGPLTLVPRPGLTVHFDDAPDNEHAVRRVRGPRYGCLAWYRAEDDERPRSRATSWILRFLLARPDTPLIARGRPSDGLAGGEGQAELPLADAHRRLVDTLPPGGFTVRDLVKSAPELTVYETLILLAEAGLLEELPTQGRDARPPPAPGSVVPC